MTPRIITSDSVVERRGDMLTQRIDDDLVMADLESGSYYGMAGTARRIWELLATPVRVSEVCETLQAEYDIDPATCARQVLAYLGELQVEDLLRLDA